MCVSLGAAVFTALCFLYTKNLSQWDYSEEVCGWVCEVVGERS